MDKDRVIRIIPRLDVKGRYLVKGIHLEGLRVMGLPEDYAKYYFNMGADELILQDVVASLYGRNNILEMVTRVASDIFIPLTVGGGIRSLSDIKNVLSAGADRVSINTHAIKNPQFIKEASEEFGRSTIVVAIEVIKQKNGQYYCFIDNGREFTGVDALEWAKKVEELGAGEIILTSVDKEGRGEGFDIELVQKILTMVNIPVIAHGGAGKIDDAIALAKNSNISGIAMAGLFHYEHVVGYNMNYNDDKEGNFQFLKSKERVFKKIHPATIKDLKQSFLKNEIAVRS